MFNLVVLCTFVAAAAAGGIVPLTYSAAILPATTTISRQASSVIHPSPLISAPLVYSSPLAYSSPLYSHLIKKRSALFASSIIAPSTYIARSPLVTSYAAPLATTYSVAAPITAAIASPFYGAHLIKKRSVAALYAAPAAVSHQSRVDIKSTPAVAYTSYSTPLAYAAPVISTPIVSAAPVARFVSAAPIAYSHLIKKRSAPLLLRSSFVRPAVYSAPLFRAPVVTPYFSSPIGYSTHFIKKRSLAVASYIAPAAVSHQSRVDFRSTPAVVSTSYSAPLYYSSPLVSRFF